MPNDDPALAAIRAALSQAGHNPAEIQVARRHRGAPEVLIEFNPMSSSNWDSGPEQHAAYAKALAEDGWQAMDLGTQVMVPDVPVDAEPGTYTSVWSVQSVNATDAEAAASEARKRQINPGITQSCWTVTDHVGRRQVVFVTDPDLSA